MTGEETKSVLCIVGGSLRYAFEFSCVEEICRDIELSQMPCLPEYIAGVCNYKGNVVPVLYMEGRPGSQTEGDVKQIVLILRYQRTLVGILMHREPYLEELAAHHRIGGPGKQDTGRQDTGLWTEEAYYVKNGDMYALIDVEKTLESLIAGG